MDSTKKPTTEVPAIFNNWPEQQKELKSQFAQLTDEDLKFETGKENELIKRIQSRLNKNRAEAISIIKTSQTEDIK